MRVPAGDIKIGPRERRYLERALRTNRLSYGPLSQKFEKLFALLHDCRFAVFCNSGTSALQMAVQALKEHHGWKDGDEIIVPAVTFVATANVVLENRLKPVFVDVEPDTYNLDAEKIERAVTRRTRAIIPVHLAGLPCDMDAIEEYNLPVIEDSCEAMFCRYKGRPVGSMGAIGCFSTYVAHYIVTGVGGLATTQDPDLAVTLRSLMNHGRDSIYLSIDDDDVTGKRLKEIVERRFHFVRTGYSFRITELEAAIGLAQLEQHRGIVRGRRRIAAYLTAGLSDLSEEIQLPTIPDDREHGFMFFPIVTRRVPKDQLVQTLEAAKIETRDLMPMLNQPVYKGMFKGRFPEAEFLMRHGFYVGCHQYLNNAQLDHVIDCIHRFFRKKKKRR